MSNNAADPAPADRYILPDAELSNEQISVAVPDGQGKQRCLRVESSEPAVPDRQSDQRQIPEPAVTDEPENRQQISELAVPDRQSDQRQIPEPAVTDEPENRQQISEPAVNDRQEMMAETQFGENLSFRYISMQA
jgi:hypothetical protein